MCRTHQRPLELFCGTDQSCVCTTCVLLEHKNHEFLSLEEACERRRSSLLQTQAQSQLMVEQRRQKIQEIQSLLELSETETDRERSVGLQAFTALMQCVQRRLDLFLEELQEKQSRSHRQAQDLLQRLEKEICDLEQSSTDSECLSHSHDPLHFLQRCTALTGLKERVQQCAVEVTLDPDTAHPKLVLSEDLKRVHHSDQKRALPESGRRFSQCCCVLGRQKFSSGRFYFEVQVEGKSEWDLGVVRESINTQGKIALKPKNGQWVVWLRSGGQYRALAGRPVVLSPRRPPRKVGVFVDYGGGVVSFYDADSADFLYSFTDCSFEESLLPFFSPCNNDRGRNSAPLILTPICKPEPVSSSEHCPDPDSLQLHSAPFCSGSRAKSLQCKTRALEEERSKKTALQGEIGRGGEWRERETERRRHNSKTATAV
uniref:B30.2/SPRY domain-containing protein n=1 Tax=Periophthalmus magnuspinnatus TaxID=409849 RepID=A0A3B4B1H4_9GOBI